MVIHASVTPARRISGASVTSCLTTASRRSPWPQVVELLDRLQPNIVKGHGREHLSVRFLHLADERGDVVPAVRRAAGQVGAKSHLEQVDAHRSQRRGPRCQRVAGSVGGSTAAVRPLH